MLYGINSNSKWHDNIYIDIVIMDICRKILTLDLFNEFL